MDCFLCFKVAFETIGIEKDVLGHADILTIMTELEWDWMSPCDVFCLDTTVCAMTLLTDWCTFNINCIWQKTFYVQRGEALKLSHEHNKILWEYCLKKTKTKQKQKNPKRKQLMADVPVLAPDQMWIKWSLHRELCPLHNSQICF